MELDETDELMTYVYMIKEILDINYGKEVVFYDAGEWYSRVHERIISMDELKQYLKEVALHPNDLN